MSNNNQNAELALLRRCAEALRALVIRDPCGRPDCEDCRMYDFEHAVADLLDRAADDFDQWHGVRAACRDLDQTGEETDEGVTCTCSHKDCYEHGKWHNCTHGRPDLTGVLAIARAYRIPPG